MNSAYVSISEHYPAAAGARLALLACALAFAGCETSVTSSGVATADIHAELHVSADGGGRVAVEAQLKRGDASSDTYLDLRSGDELWLSNGPAIDEVSLSDDLFGQLPATGERHQRLQRGQSLGFNFLWLIIFTGRTWYSGELDAGDGNFTLALLRERGGDAPDSTVSLPPAFALSAPLPGESYSRGVDAITVNWTPSGSAADMQLNVATACIDGDDDDFSLPLAGDTGSATINAGSLGGSGQCTSRVELTRSLAGSLDPAYGNGGVIGGHQVRAVNITTVD